jgi:hypothetical protein
MNLEKYDEMIADFLNKSKSIILNSRIAKDDKTNGEVRLIF